MTDSQPQPKIQKPRSRLSLSPFAYANLAGLGIGAAYFIRAASKPMTGHVIDSINLIIHEGGHTLFFWGPFWLEILGGSLFQVLLPLGLAVYAWVKRHPVVAAVLLLWTGQSLINVSVYAGDALRQQLPLIAEGVTHDWNHLLWQFGALRHTALIAGIIKYLGWLTIGLGLGYGVYASIRDGREEDEIRAFTAFQQQRRGN